MQDPFKYLAAESSGTVTFRYGYGSVDPYWYHWIRDPDPGSCVFSVAFKITNLLLTLGTFTSLLRKGIKKSQKCRNHVFSKIILLVDERIRMRSQIQTTCNGS
jgi:hypothetical protein